MKFFYLLNLFFFHLVFYSIKDKIRIKKLSLLDAWIKWNNNYVQHEQEG